MMMTLRFAVFSFALVMLAADAAAQAPPWSVDTGAHEFTMSVTAALNGVAAAAGDGLCAYVDGDASNTCRGLTDAILVGSGPTTRHLFFLTIYGSSFGETIRFRMYDASLDSVHVSTDSLGFSPDSIVGDPSSPHLLGLVGVPTAVEQPDRDVIINGLWPNPTAGAFSVRFQSVGEGRVAVFDALGRQKTIAADGFVRGTQTVDLDASGWAPGLYIITISTGGRHYARTLTVTR